MIDTIFIGGKEMDYCRFGSGPRPLVILPGLSVTPITPAEGALNRAFGAFCATHTVYVFDRRKQPDPDTTIERLAGDAAAGMRALGLSHADLFGASQGGMMAQVIASTAPELVNRLVVASASGKTTGLLTQRVNDWVALAQNGNGAALGRSFFGAIYNAASLKKLGNAPERLGKLYTPGQLAHFLAVAPSLLRFDGVPPESITCPTLVIGADGDRVIGPEEIRALARELKCEIYMYDNNYGHAVYDEAPDFMARVAAFLNP